MGIVRSLFGGPRLPLQPTGPAPFTQPDEHDRRALFWWLKRNTSFTAIEHNAKLWADFAQRWEGWLRQQEDPYAHDVETLKFVLDTQLAYERGLSRLQKGDRSVFNRKSSEGWLVKLWTQLPARRYEWEAPTPELNASMSGHPVDVVQSYFKAHESAMACGHQGTYRGMAPYLGVVSSAIQARRVLAKLSIDTSLPEPRWDVSFAPGERAPKDGIYEMVNRDGHIVGGLRFFIKGEAADPEDVVEFGPGSVNEHGTNFLWRLLWEDTRYKDGTIPEEEANYPLPEPFDPPAERKAYSQPAPETQCLRCDAGQPCPQEGWWFTPAKAGSRRRFQQGEVMPDFKSDYGRTIWQWDEQQESGPQ